MLDPKIIAEMASNKYPDTDNVLLQTVVVSERNAYIAAFTDAMELILSTHVPLKEVENILNTVCHPDHASELIGYIRPLVGKTSTNINLTKK